MHDSLPEVLSRQQELSLYIHIPFCIHKCDYCSFYSHTLKESNHRITLVAERILDEIEKSVQLFGKPIRTLFIGGGNPGILPVSLLREFSETAGSLGKPQEITLECNPESVSEPLIELLEEGIFTRLSMGIQSFSPEALRILGRNYSDVTHITSLIKSFAYPGRSWNFNIDLITGIPGIAPETSLHDIDRALYDGNPDHISLYELSIEEGTPLAKRFRRTIDEESEGEGTSLQVLWNHLQKSGFKHYEVSNFSRNRKSDTRSLHNLQYWRMRPSFGIGASAASTLYDRTGLQRIECIADTNRYTEGETLSPSLYRRESVDGLEALEEFLMMGLRVEEGISLSRFRNIFGYSFADLFSETLQKYLKKGAGILTSERFSITEAGWIVLNRILVDLFYEVEKRSLNGSIDLTPVFEL